MQEILHYSCFLSWRLCCRYSEFRAEIALRQFQLVSREDPILKNLPDPLSWGYTIIMCLRTSHWKPPQGKNCTTVARGFKSSLTTLRLWLSKGRYSTVPGSYCEATLASGMANFIPQDSWLHTMVHRLSLQTIKKQRNTTLCSRVVNIGIGLLNHGQFLHWVASQVWLLALAQHCHLLNPAKNVHTRVYTHTAGALQHDSKNT